MRRIQCLRPPLLLLISGVCSNLWAVPPPAAVEMTSLLEAFKLHHKTGVLDLNARSGANGAFLDPQARLRVEISRKGDPRPVVSRPVRVRSLGKVWSNLQVEGAPLFQFAEAGEFTIRYLVDGKLITSFDFQVMKVEGDDPFAPTSFFYADGPWNELGFVQVVNGNPSTPLTFKLFTRQATVKPDNDLKATVELFHGNERVALANPGGVAWSEWSLKEFDFSFPVEQGGRKFTFADLVKNDGDYRITVKLDGDLYGHYPITVRSGKVVGHPRQDMAHTPPHEWLVPRRNSGLDTADPIFYLARSLTPQATNAETGPGDRLSQKADDHDSDPRRWQVVPNVDPKRPFQVVHTDILTRRDTPIAVGDDVVAFATGRRGVAYFRVGENKQRSIPDGQSYRGDLFFVCGKLIVLANQYNLFVHDTVSGRTEAIEDSDVHLRYQKAALYGPRLVDADGYLVVTVNEPTRVRDRAVIKVVDLSGEEPVVISLRGGLAVDDVSTVKVSARYGYVAVGSKRAKAIYVARIGLGAQLRRFDLSGEDGLGEADMALLDRYVVYQDAAGFRNLRALDLENGSVLVPEYSQHGGSWGTSVTTNGRLIAWPARDPRSAFVVSDGFEQTRLLSNSGDKVAAAGNRGMYGVGNSAWMSRDGTLFIAGSQSISEQKCLQLSVKDQWQAVIDEAGAPISAIDVVGSNAMIAFKTGQRSTSAPLRISYATFGERVNYVPHTSSRQALISSSDGVAPEVAAPSAANEPTEAAASVPQIDVAKEAFLATTLDSEQQIYEALVPALGKEKAKARAVETAIRALRANGHEDWISDYRARSELAD